MLVQVSVAHLMPCTAIAALCAAALICAPAWLLRLRCHCAPLQLHPYGQGQTVRVNMVGTLTSELPAFMPALAVTMIDLIQGLWVQGNEAYAN